MDKDRGQVVLERSRVIGCVFWTLFNFLTFLGVCLWPFTAPAGRFETFDFKLLVGLGIFAFFALYAAGVFYGELTRPYRERVTFDPATDTVMIAVHRLTGSSYRQLKRADITAVDWLFPGPGAPADCTTNVRLRIADGSEFNIDVSYTPAATFAEALGLKLNSIDMFAENTTAAAAQSAPTPAT